MDNESFRNMEKYDKIVRNNIKTGMSVEQAVETADYMYDDSVEYGRTPDIPDFATSSTPQNFDMYLDSVRGYPFCIHIPRMGKNVAREFVANQLSFLGTIKRIDFVRNKNFVTKKVDDYYKRAFVHFYDGYYNSEYAFRVFSDIKSTGQCNFMPAAYDRVWYLQYAEDPIQDTDLNIHQLAHVYNIIDDKVIDIEQKMVQQDAVIEQLHAKNDYLEDNISELQKTIVSMQQYIEQLSQRLETQIEESNAAKRFQDRQDQDEKCRDVFIHSSRN